ncbi:hypothetical protein KILIM_134_00010, partial [Kineosphaera limosa NBRC 100340]
MPRPILRVLSTAACAALVGTTATATPASATELVTTELVAAARAAADAASCASLQGTKIPAKSIGLSTRGATLTAATQLTTPTTGSYCQVTGEIHPVDRTAPA